MPDRQLILASASSSRAAMLERAGVAVEVIPSRLEESEVRAQCRAEGKPVAAVAEALALAKAEPASTQYPGAFVIGADQMLECEGDWFDKPGDMNAARVQLQRLRGRTHALVTGACVVCDGECVWRSTETARMAMVDFSDAFLDAYLAAEGENVLSSVGCYQLEGRGAQLFDRVEGDFFCILGLPLLPLLGFLREQGVLLP